jgi:hypothetical protein
MKKLNIDYLVKMYISRTELAIAHGQNPAKIIPPIRKLLMDWQKRAQTSTIFYNSNDGSLIFKRKG